MRRALVFALFLAGCSLSAYDPFGVAADARGKPLTCTDGRLSEGESDVDCGGPCAPCGDGKRCATTDDCARSECLKRVCGGENACDPAGSDDCGDRCGRIVDTCGVAHDCGGCTQPATCGGGGIDHVCGCSGADCGACTPSCGTNECGSDGCHGSCGSCSTPPAPRCDGSVRVTATAAGTCEAGRCKYAELRENCPNGCAAGACVTTTTCDAPKRSCGGICAACPMGGGLLGTTCSGTACVATGCAPGFEACAAGCCMFRDAVVDDALKLADVAVGADGTVHVAYLKTFQGATSAFYARGGATWTTERIGVAADGFVSISLGPDGLPRVDYEGTSAGWMHAERTSGHWVSTPITGIVGVAQAVTDPDGIAYALGTDYDPRRPREGHLSVASFDGTSGAYTATLEYVEPGNAFPSLASRGYVLAAGYVVRSDPMNQWVNGGLKVGSGASSSSFFAGWVYTDGSASNGIGDELGDTSVALDPAFHWRVAFVNGRQRNLSLSTEAANTPVALVARNDVALVRLQVDESGANQAVYATKAGELRQVKGASAPFTDASLVANAGATTKFGFALDASGHPVVAWVDGTQKKLRVLRYGP